MAFVGECNQSALFVKHSILSLFVSFFCALDLFSGLPYPEQTGLTDIKKIFFCVCVCGKPLFSSLLVYYDKGFCLCVCLFFLYIKTSSPIPITPGVDGRGKRALSAAIDCFC